MSPISEQLFRSSLSHVRRELKALGFNKKKVMATKVSRTFVPSFRKQAYFTSDGEIFIPILQPKRNVRDMLRHEYGHALLFYYPSIGSRKGFVVFGGTTDCNDYVSKYAMTKPEEDFCETFMVYMKFKGKLKNKCSQRLQEKWSFIRKIRSYAASS